MEKEELEARSFISTNCSQVATLSFPCRHQLKKNLEPQNAALLKSSLPLPHPLREHLWTRRMMRASRGALMGALFYRWGLLLDLKKIYIYIYEHTGIPQNDMGKLPLNDDDDDDECDSM